MPLLDDYNNSQNTDFKYKVQAALVTTAVAIQSEGTGVANHAERSAYALKVLANPAGYANVMSLGFTADGAVNLSSDDTAIKNRASAIWNAYCVGA
jgi:hypothetical protein